VSRSLQHTAGGLAPDSAHEGADDAFDLGNGLQGRGARHCASLLEQAAVRFDWVDIRAFVPHASARESGQATTAIALSLWHARQRFCPSCGSAVRPALSGWAQRCENAADGNRTLFPRIEPAVITAIVDTSDRLLLQHNKAWVNPRLFSVCAGFVEAGENLEHACRREAKEEVGVDVGEVRYLGSQPWPFPASLMTAFKGRARSTGVLADGIETDEARWVTREEYAAELASGCMQVPGKAAIARYMIEQWYGGEL
jgi:NAD+ diphosphatase